MVIKGNAHIRALGIMVSGVVLLYLNYEIWNHFDTYLRNLCVLSGMIVAFSFTLVVSIFLAFTVFIYFALVEGLEECDIRCK